MKSVLDRRRERLQAGFHRSQILLPGAQAVVKLLPLLLPERAMGAVAKHTQGIHQHVGPEIKHGRFTIQ